MNWEKIGINDCELDLLRSALSGDFDSVCDEIDRDIAQLYRVENGSIAVVRVETNSAGTELVLVAYAGRGAAAAIADLQSVAKTKKINSIRIHTFHNEKLANRYLGACGFSRLETVYRWQNGR